MMDMSEEALIYKCANLYQLYVISQDVADRDKYLKLYDTLDNEKKRKVLHIIANNLRKLKIDIIPTYETSRVR